MLHHKTLAAAVEKYGHLSAKAPELTAALKADEKGWTDDEIQEIFDKITQSKPEAKPSLNKLYDKHRGEWKASKSLRNGFVTEWVFVPDSAGPNKTGIPMTPEQAELFNSTRRLRQGKTPTEQLYPHGQNIPIYDRPENPYEEVNL